MKRLAEALDLVRTSRSRIGKERALAAALASVERGDDIALATAARFAAGRALPTGDGRSLGAGFSLFLDVGSAMTGFPESIVGACARKTGDLGEALGLLAARREGGERPGLTLGEVAQLFDALAASGQRSVKRQLLLDAFSEASALEVKYLSRLLLGSMRTGAQQGVVEGAIARAFSAKPADVRRAIALVADPGLCAVIARSGRLAAVQLVFGRPVAWMLATPIETLASPIDPALFVIEDKIDGVRVQAHRRERNDDGGTFEVALFARGMERVTAAFPEVVDALDGATGEVALDGEIVARSEGGRPRPFQTLQPRLKKLVPSREQLAETPVTLVVYDLLADGGGSCLDLSWTERRARLEAFVRTVPEHPALSLHPYRPASSVTMDVAFAEARAKGFEGLVLKRVDAPYEAGRRGQAWLKVKRAYATLDVVVTAAEEGHGRRAGVLSDYTFAVWKGDTLVNVGKAYSGLTDDEIREMTQRLSMRVVEQVGRVRVVRPDIVLEVAFDGVQPSPRHDSGFALRFPRIVRIREDKGAVDADRLETVEALFAAQVAEGHREEGPAVRSTDRARRKKPIREDRQLALFESPHLDRYPKG
jgi:DNA ligase-1